MTETKPDPDKGKQYDGAPNYKPDPEWKAGVGVGFLILLGSVVLWNLCAVGLKDSPKDFWQVFMGAEVSYLILMAMLHQSHIYKRQWEAMGESLRQQRDLFAISERAYMACEAVDLVEPLVAGTPPAIQVTLVNGGKTPAWNYLTFAKFTVEDEVLSQDQVLSKNPGSRIDEIRPTTGTFIRSQGKATANIRSSSFLLTERGLTLVKSRDKFLYVLIHLIYQDFDREWQELRFAAIYDPNIRTGRKGETVEGFMTCHSPEAVRIHQQHQNNQQAELEQGN